MARAAAAAARLQVPFLPRGRKEPIGPWVGVVAERLLVFETGGVALLEAEGLLRFHPGMSRVRLKRFDAGVLEDNLLRYAELKAGERVLDATLGLAQDAQVAARAVGASGRVVGVERSLPLFALVSEGLALRASWPGACRIEPVLGDSLEVLRAIATGAFDCVLLDPMFERPVRAEPSFRMLRRLADPTPLTAELLAEAGRVASRRVLVKAWRGSGTLARLGLRLLGSSRHSDTAWACL